MDLLNLFQHPSHAFLNLIIVLTTLGGKQYNRLNLSALWLGLDKSKNGNQYYYPGVVTRLVQNGEISQYLKPSATRHNFIAIQAHAGVDLKLLADSVGNSVDVIYDHYLGLTSLSVEIREILSGCYESG